MFLSGAGKVIGDLKTTGSETKTKAATKNIPTSFLKEYTSTMKSHIEIIHESRSLFESASIKDAKTFSKTNSWLRQTAGCSG